VPTVRLALAQLNLVVGDLAGNVTRIAEAIGDARDARADLVVLPELAISGYPPEDLLLKPGFIRAEQAALAEVAALATDVVVIVGHSDPAGGALFNAASVCAGGRVAGTYHKRHLPNYGVFDEHRWFEEGTGSHRLFEVGGARIGVSVCEDAWVADGPVAAQGRGGAELVVNINASPYHRGKLVEREAMLEARATEAGCPLVYLNVVGGQDELVFDGASLVVGADGSVLARGPQFEEALLLVDVDVDARPLPPDALEIVAVHGAPERTDRARAVPPMAEPLQPVDELYEALVLGTRDYLGKNGFGDVVIGLSGGIDSSLVAAIAVDALGPDRVHGVLMPSRYSSHHSLTDAEKLGANLGLDLRTIPIEPAHAALEDMLAPSFAGHQQDLTEENLQSRIRGVTLMALSNKFGWIVLTTGNKSEMAVGYSTLYGDTAGGYAVIKDVFKLWVYELCARRNERAGRELVPAHVLTKPPSAELRPDQRDDQSLPPYEVLDPILEAYIEDDRTMAELVGEGFDPDVVERIVRLVDNAEYKRRQTPIGVRITTKAFGRDRRLPITNKFRG
jgi:NAD+ synthase (glutamine-hydrolysing)